MYWIGIGVHFCLFNRITPDINRWVQKRKFQVLTHSHMEKQKCLIQSHQRLLVQCKIYLLNTLLHYLAFE